MPDQGNAPVDELADAPPDLSSEIASSLASVWARYVGARPTGCVVEIDDGVVRWHLPEGLADLRTGIEAPVESDAAPQTMTGYRRATSAAVSKVTHRRVSAHISREDKETGASTETFILEAITKKY